MTVRSGFDEDAEVRFATELFFQVLDSIRYARDVFNPRYRSLETRIKLRTTSELRRIAELASEHFCTLRRLEGARYDTEGAIEKLKAQAIEHAIDTMEGP